MTDPITYTILTNNAQAKRTWTDDQIADIQQHALDIYARLKVPRRLRSEVFHSVLMMVGQVDVQESPVEVPSTVRTIEGGKRHGR